MILSNSPGTSTGQIVQTVGKHWILTNKIVGTGKAANYSWYFKGATFGGQKFEASVSLPGQRVIQGIGTAHDASHSDYSQVCVIASNQCTYMGQPARLSDLLTDPEASKLLSIEGPLKITRQPGVSQLEPTTTTDGPAITRAQVVALSDNLPQREAMILSWVEQGSGEYEWVPVTTGDLTFWVFGDALKFGGVRINVSATLEQHIADRLDASLLTARMADLVFQAASKIIQPIPLTQKGTAGMSSTAWMVNESDKIDAALQAVGA